MFEAWGFVKGGKERKRMGWWENAVFYEIYPRSFKDSNADGVGDLVGIIEKLDYLNDGKGGGLGVDALWICPFYKSPMADFGYDITDYCAVDPLFGTMDDFKRLLAEAHKRGLKIVVDLVMNHTSDQHPWFLEARSSRDSPKHDWYLWQDKGDGRKPNNWKSALERKSAWWLNPATDEFYLGSISQRQPELNWRNPEVRLALYEVVRFWLGLGVDGFRMDLCNTYVKDEQFRSNPFRFKGKDELWQRHLYDRNQPEVHPILREVRKIVDSFGDRVLIGEIIGQDPKLSASYHGHDLDELHLAFNFDFLGQPWSAEAFHDSIERYYDALPEGAWPNFTLSNHDQPRHYFRYRKFRRSDDRARCAILMMLTLRGTPFLYYGEEIGMTCFRIPRKRLQDPLAVTTWPIKEPGRDIERTPMQWDMEINSGFSTVRPWLPVNPDYRERNVESQRKDKESILNFYRDAIKLRHENRALSKGDFEFVDTPPGLLGYVRDLHDGVTQKVLVLMNFSDQNIEYILPENANVLLGSMLDKGEELNAGKVVVHDSEAIVFGLPPD
jgi:alpha-glucosidase